MDNTIFTTRTLLGAYYDKDVSVAPSNYWLSLCFPGQINFDTEYVDFTRISDQRKLAPLVLPTLQGKPVYSAAEERIQLKPAYVKPKDAVSASRVIKKVAGMGELHQGSNMTPAARYNLLVADILRQHRIAIERRWEWLAAEAILYGQVTLVDEAYPTTIVNFQRAGGHTVTLGAAARWGDSGVSILNNVESWRTTMRRAAFGGVSNRMTVGAAVWEVMRQDSEIREMLKADSYRANSGGVDLNLGMREGLDVEFVGRLSGTLEVFVYSDYYQLADGTVTPFMDPRDIVLTSPSVEGVRCFGAIQDTKAGMQSLEVFPKMWDAEDPSATFIMTQSAPLMVPINPNATFRARVIA